MTMNRLMKTLARSAVRYMELDDAEKSRACVEVLAFIRDRGYDTTIRGKFDFPIVAND
jgi:hypothetical protein